MAKKHRTFNADRFLDKLQGREDLLRAFVGLWRDGLEIDLTELDIPTFRKFLNEGGGSDKGELLEELHRVYDLCNPEGHLHIVSACAAYTRYDPGPTGDTPVEILSLKVRAEHEDAFNLAYDRYNMEQAERFTVFSGREARAIDDVAAATERFHAKLQEVFFRDKQSDNVIVRQYQEGSRTNFVVYHEQHSKAELIFKGKKTRLKVAPEILRPAQQDFISYDSATGQVEIETRYQKEEVAIRKGFAACCFDDEEFFEGDAATRFLVLSRIREPGFEPQVRSGDTAALVALRFKLPEKPRSTFFVSSDNVLRTLELNHMRSRLQGAEIHLAAFRFTFAGDARPRRVELGGTNRIKFKRVTHEDEVLGYLKAWKILRE